MQPNEIRKKFLDFFEKKGHKIVPSFSLLPSDPSVLFTTAGMQQFKPYYLGEKSPYGPNTASCQKCFRTSDIDEVGDERHLTFFEMLGNFSFAVSAEASGEDENGYFKKEALNLAIEFLKNMGLKIEDLNFSYFHGEKEISEDRESKEILLEYGIKENKIFGMGKADNFWGPTGKEGPCGPTVEIYVNELEIWNLVFNEYYQDNKEKLTPLKQRGVDTGMGLERLTMVLQNKNTVFETDLFEPIIKEISNLKFQISNLNEKSVRIIADHIKSAVFLISDGVLPSNVEQGYVLRRILRRTIRYGKLLNLFSKFLIPLAQKTIEVYKDTYPELKSKEAALLIVIQNEEEKFEKTLDKGLKEFKIQNSKFKIQKIIPGKVVFDLYQNYGFPLELTEELAKERGIRIDKNGFERAREEHQKISRLGAEKKFGGHGIITSHIPHLTSHISKLHTATHLLHSALREILGESVKQMGSDITLERLRFDFSYFQKMTQDEIKKVEDLVNQKIKEDLEIKKQEMNLEDALRTGALAFFKEKYPEKVYVYTILDPQTNEVFSKEICAGPHVGKTLGLGHFKIIKEESSGAGIRRIKAVLK
jgi:alanyl-tRNA synthetase